MRDLGNLRARLGVLASRWVLFASAACLAITALMSMACLPVLGRGLPRSELVFVVAVAAATAAGLCVGRRWGTARSERQLAAAESAQARETAQQSAIVSEKQARLLEVSERMMLNIEETMLRAEGVAKAANSVGESVRQAADAVGDVRNSLFEIAGEANRTTALTADAVRSAQELGSSVQILESGSFHIDGVVSSIRQIAAQTKMIALNARVEATRVGRRGEPFAVVADEVSNLAQLTAHASQSAMDRLAGLQAAITESTARIAEMRDLIEGASTAQETIAGLVREHTLTADAILESIAAAAVHTGDIARSVTSVALAARTTRDGAEASFETARLER